MQESTKLITICHIWRWPIIRNSENPAGKVLSRLCFGKWGVLLAFHITHKVFYILFFYFSAVNFDQFSNGSGILENSENWEPNRSQNWRTGTGLNRTFGSVPSVPVLCISSELNFGNTNIYNKSQGVSFVTQGFSRKPGFLIRISPYTMSLYCRTPLNLYTISYIRWLKLMIG